MAKACDFCAGAERLIFRLTGSFSGFRTKPRERNCTLRVGTVPSAVRVEVSVDGEPWQACRAGSGYWWFDWIGFETGEHSLRARAHGHDGATAQSKPRRFRRVNG